jgi:poly(3-hydroxybutyrate) depolymerase/sugar lactone lactonase YvrE
MEHTCGSVETEETMRRKPCLLLAGWVFLLAMGLEGRGAAAPIQWTITVDGVTRTALVEPGKDAATTLSPLVIVFHSVITSPASTVKHGIAAAWPEATIVYPQAQSLTNPFGLMGVQWQSFPGEANDRDLRFVDALIEDLKREYRVDERRIYAAGFQNGGIFTQLLRTERENRFAAFAILTGFALPNMKWARTPRPTLLIHGKRDEAIPIGYGEWARDQLIRLNGCATEGVYQASGVETYDPCATGAPIVWLSHAGGHEWPAQATATLVQFFREHSLTSLPARRVSAPEPVAGETVAGTGQAGFTGDQAAATTARLFFPQGITLDREGGFLVVDTGNSRIRRVDGSGVIRTTVGTIGGIGLYQGTPDREGIAANRAHLSFPESIAVDREGNLFIADTAMGSVRRVGTDGAVRTVVRWEQLRFPTGLAVDAQGVLYIADPERHRVMRLAGDGTLAIAAGTGVAGFAGDGGRAVAAQLNAPWSLAVDQRGNLYIADAANHRVRKVAADGTIMTVAGAGSAGFSGDGGPAVGAQLNHPTALAVDSQDSLFIVDTRNHRVRRVDSAGTIRTVYGGEGSENATPSVSPAGVAIDRSGNLLIVDAYRHRVVRLPGVAAPGFLAGRAFPAP